MVSDFQTPQAGLIHAGSEDVQLGLAHRPLQAQQQPVVVIARVVEAVQVGQQCVEQGTVLQQVMPVAARAGQAAHLDAQVDADVVEADLGQEPLEAGPVLGGPSALALVVVDGQDA